LSFRALKEKTQFLIFFGPLQFFFELLNLNESPILKRTPPSKSVEIQKKKNQKTAMKEEKTLQLCL